MYAPQQLDFPSLAFPKDRTVLMVGEVALKWRVTEQHVIDLIVEGKLAAFDIAGRQDYVRVPMDAMHEISRQSGLPLETLLSIVRTAKPKTTGRAYWRVPVAEGFTAFMRENNAGAGAVAAK